MTCLIGFLQEVLFECTANTYSVARVAVWHAYKLYCCMLLSLGLILFMLPHDSIAATYSIWLLCNVINWRLRCQKHSEINSTNGAGPVAVTKVDGVPQIGARRGK